MEYVYWIRRRIHTNPHTQGYVGISNDPERRYKEHLTACVNEHLQHAFNLYDDIELSILHKCATRQESCELELMYRPKVNVGWNIIKGGDSPPRNHLTDDVRNRISQTHKTRGTNPYSANTHSPEAIARRKLAVKGMYWFYNPLTSETGKFKICPDGWLSGRKPKAPKKIRGVDYVAHVATWEVISPNKEVYQITNLKHWCNQRDIPYLRVYQSQCGWSVTKNN